MVLRVLTDYPVPRQGSEGGISRPLDHMRQIPFELAPQFHPLLKLRFSHIYIWNSSRFVFHVERFEIWACARAKNWIYSQTSIKRPRSPFTMPNWLILLYFTSIKRSHSQLQCDILTRRQANQGWSSLTMQLLDVFLIFWVTVVENATGLRSYQDNKNSLNFRWPDKTNSSPIRTAIKQQKLIPA